MKFSQPKLTGRLGELLAVYELEKRGIQVAHVDRDDVDLWVRTPTGRMKTVQVKATAAPISNGSTLQRYHFNTQSACHADLYGLVALDSEIMLFCPCTAGGTQWFHPDSFSPEAMEASIKEHLA